MTTMVNCVLIVDDDPAFRRLACRIVAGLGLAVAGEAGTFAAAVAAAAELHPDAALVDFGLPDGDGVTLAAHLVALPGRPRVVLTSSDPDAITAATAEQAGAVGFLPKSELTDGSLRRMLTGEER
jgi:DNA-binding NarL/FixJ family response regulator